MNLTGIVTLGRSWAESLMTDAGALTRAGPKAWDEELGEYIPTRITVYAGRARLRQPDTQSDRVLVLGETETLSELILSLPVATSTGVLTDDVFEVTNSEFDAELVGKRFRVKGPHGQSHATARRFRVEVLS